MHRVNTKRKQAAALRFAAYAVTLTLSILTTVVLLYIALGYRFDGSNGQLIRSGLLLVDNQPEAASIYINNELKDENAPGRFVLSTGNYDLALKKEGYRDWSKNINVAASGVREVNYPILIPNELTARKLIDFEAPTLISQSNDRKFLLTHQTNQAAFSLTELDPKEPKQSSLVLNGAFSRENSQIGTIKVIEWALNNKQLLLEHVLPSGKTELISFDRTKPEEAINISKLYPNEVLADIHYIGGDTDVMYGLVNGILKTFRLDKTESEILLQDIVSYQPYSDDTILFTRATATGKNEVGIWQDKAVVIIEKDIDPTAAPLLTYARYDDQYYFTVAYSGGNAVTIYRNPLKKPILAKQLPFASFAFEKPTSVLFSDSAQFVMVQNGNTFKAYDLEDLKLFNVTLPFALAQDTKLTWIDGHHIQATAADNTSYILEYDGQNQQTLLPTKAGTRLYFANNFQHAYRINDLAGNIQLEVTSLVNGKE